MKKENWKTFAIQLFVLFLANMVFVGLWMAINLGYITF